MHPDLDSVNHTCLFLGKRHVTFGQNSPTPLVDRSQDLCGAQDPVTSCQIIDVTLYMLYIVILFYDSLVEGCRHESFATERRLLRKVHRTIVFMQSHSHQLLRVAFA